MSAASIRYYPPVTAYHACLVRRKYVTRSYRPGFTVEAGLCTKVLIGGTFDCLWECYLAIDAYTCGPYTGRMGQYKLSAKNMGLLNRLISKDGDSSETKLQKIAQRRIKELLSRGFRLVENGLDPDEVMGFLELALGSNEIVLKRLEYITALEQRSKILKAMIAETSLLVEGMKKQAQVEAEVEAARIINEAQRKAKEIMELVRKQGSDPVIKDTILQAEEMGKTPSQLVKEKLSLGVEAGLNATNGFEKSGNGTNPAAKLQAGSPVSSQAPVVNTPADSRRSRTPETDDEVIDFLNRLQSENEILPPPVVETPDDTVQKEMSAADDKIMDLLRSLRGSKEPSPVSGVESPSNNGHKDPAPANGPVMDIFKLLQADNSVESPPVADTPAGKRQPEPSSGNDELMDLLKKLQGDNDSLSVPAVESHSNNGHNGHKDPAPANEPVMDIFKLLQDDEGVESPPVADTPAGERHQGSSSTNDQLMELLQSLQVDDKPAVTPAVEAPSHNGHKEKAPTDAQVLDWLTLLQTDSSSDSRVATRPEGIKVNSQKAPSDSQEDNEFLPYTGEVTVEIPQGVGRDWLKQLRQQLSGTRGVRIQLEAGKGAGGSALTLFLDEPVALVPILLDMPDVQRVIESQGQGKGDRSRRPARGQKNNPADRPRVTLTIVLDQNTSGSAR